MPPEAPPYRRLTLIDLMGLVVVSGLVLSSYARLLAARGRSLDWPRRMGDSLLLISLLCLALSWWVVARGLGRLGVERHEPGFLTALAIVLGSGIVAVVHFYYLALLARSTGPPAWSQFLVIYLSSTSLQGSPTVEAAVAITWLVLGLLGSWKRAGGTLDRLGVALGGAFLALFAVNHLLMWLAR